MKQLLLISAATALASLAGCVHVDPVQVEVKPIHITMDINVKVDRQLDDFFAYQDKYQRAAPPSTQPAAIPPVTPQ